VRRVTRLLAIAAASVPLLALGPVEQPASTHWALLIGISDYIHFDDVEGGDLPGAEHDALAWRDYFVMHERFPEENVRVLLNGDATKAAIEAGITGWLADNAQQGDNVVVFFAGHGSQMWDESGDEDDGLDETIAPADVLPNSTAADISDDEFNRWLGTIATENVVVILDNCNSGTGTRDVTPFSRARLLGRSIEDVDRPATLTRRALPGERDETGFDSDRTQVLELAAAQPYQIAVDAYFPATDGSEAFYGGAFSTFLLQALWKAPPNATYQDVFEHTYEALKRNRFEQDPFISEMSLKDRPIFFVEGAPSGEADMSLPVTAVTGSTAVLGAGLTLGITPGSIFHTGSGARLVAESVAPRLTSVRVESGEVAEGDYAALTAYRFGRAPLLVNVAGIETRLSEALRTALADAPSVRLVETEGTFSHLIVRRRAEGLRIVGADGFVRHDALDADPAAMGRVADLLHKEAAAKSLADIENPAQAFSFELELLDGKTSFGLGEEIAFAVESQRDGFLTLIDIGPDGTVSMLLPNEETPEVRVQAGRRLTYPQGGVYFEAQPPVGTGLVRAFVTPEPLAISSPGGETYRFGGASFATEVGGALIATVGTDAGAVRLEGWGTAAVVYEIRN